MGFEIRKTAEEYGKRLLERLPEGKDYSISDTENALSRIMGGLQGEHAYTVFENTVFHKAVELCRQCNANPKKENDNKLSFPKDDILNEEDIAELILSHIRPDISRLSAEKIKDKVEDCWDDVVAPILFERIEEMAQDYFYDRRNG